MVSTLPLAATNSRSFPDSAKALIHILPRLGKSLITSCTVRFRQFQL